MGGKYNCLALWNFISFFDKDRTAAVAHAQAEAFDKERATIVPGLVVVEEAVAPIVEMRRAFDEVSAKFGEENADFDALLNQAYAIPDVEERRKLMGEMEKILQDSGVLVQPYWRSTFRHMTDRVHGLVMHPTFEIHLETTWLDAA